MGMKNFFKTISHKDSVVDPVTAAVSQAAQENQVAAKRLDETLCRTLDGPNCEQNTLQVTRICLP